MVWKSRNCKKKKLTGAVDYWLGDKQVSDNKELLEDAARYNIEIAEPVEVDYEIWEEHWQIFQIFAALQSQWRFCESRITGQDYGSFFELLSLYAVVNRREAFEHFQILESAALDIFRKRADKEQKVQEAKSKRTRRK